MSTKVALEHRTTYRFDRPVGIGPHVIRLRPAPHSRTPVEAYSLSVTPSDAYLNWQQDPFGNFLARVVFPTKADVLEITVGLVADLRAINPFDFFLEDYAERFPFRYPPDLAADLQPYLNGSVEGAEVDPVLRHWLDALPASRAAGQPVIDFLAALNGAVHRDVAYSVRMEEGVQTPAQTLTRAIGSCRDSAWLLVTALRHFGLAARFVSGYLVQLASDAPSLDGPSGPTADFTDLHAWAEVFIPGAGWIGLDATSALFASEGHIPLAATPNPSSAAAITGLTEPATTSMDYVNAVRRVHEDAGVTRPYTPGQTEQLHRLGRRVDERLSAAGISLTLGGKPTFVSVDDQTSPEWTTAVDGPQKRAAAGRLAASLGRRFAPGGLVQRSHGRWHPGESAPRWRVGLVWLRDGTTLWRDPALLADPDDQSQAGPDAAAAAQALARQISQSFGLPADQAQPVYEDPLDVLAADVRQPLGPPLADGASTVTPALVERLDAAETIPAAWVLPLVPSWFGDAWASPAWRTRRGRLVLIPGSSPAGLRLPLGSLSWRSPDYVGEASYPTAEAPLPEPEPGPRAVVADPEEVRARTALVVQARNGFVHVFLPPLEQLDRFVELVRLVEQSAAALRTPVVLEGYGPPPDPRAGTVTLTPGVGVLAVHLPPAASWDELSELIHAVYELAGQQRLGAETFGLDGGQHGTGGGHPLVLGGPQPARSPLLTRPDLLVSLLTFWQHHPALSYLFAGRFVGPFSPAARVDEGSPAALGELEIALAELGGLNGDGHRPWSGDRSLRHLLTDASGDPSRAEFGLDHFYPPDSTRDRRGLVELRGFEMAPHPDLALVQALLVRALLARFAEDPYAGPLVRWGTALHDRFLLPHFLLADIAEVVADLRRHQLDFDLAWLAPQLEFRFPVVGATTIGGVRLELRSAIEARTVRGEQPGAAGSSRLVDASTERLQVAVTGFVPEQQILTCNGRPVPLAPTETPGGYVAGVRYQAWPSTGQHPTLPVDAPLHFDLVDRSSRLSLGGATYHVVHPGGRAYSSPPVNAKEAEARRARRFEAMGHTAGEIDVEALLTAQAWRDAAGQDCPVTLELRRRSSATGGRPR